MDLYDQLHTTNIHHAEVCAFLRHLLRHLRGPVIVLWDNGRIHRGQLIRDFCRAFPRLHVEFFPASARELNPNESVWRRAKAALANGRPDDQGALAAHLRTSLTRLRRSQRALRGCITNPTCLPFCLDHCITYAVVNNGTIMFIITAVVGAALTAE